MEPLTGEAGNSESMSISSCSVRADGDETGRDEDVLGRGSSAAPESTCIGSSMSVEVPGREVERDDARPESSSRQSIPSLVKTVRGSWSPTSRSRKTGGTFSSCRRGRFSSGE